MPKIHVENKREIKDGEHLFRVNVFWEAHAKKNRMAFEQKCPKHKLTKEKLEEINSNFANSIRVCKYEGAYFPDDTPSVAAKTILNKWTTNDLGIAIKVGDDPVNEFKRFALQ